MKLNVFKRTIGLLPIALLCLSGVAHAQFVPGQGGGATTIYADQGVYEGNRTTLIGGVDVRQGNTRVLADKMVIETGAGGLQSSNFKRIDAIGHFYYITPEQEVRGDRGVYTKVNDTFIVSGNVIFKQPDGNVVTGTKLYYNLGKQTARVIGNCKGRKCGSKGRVNILIKNSDTQTGKS